MGLVGPKRKPRAVAISYPAVADVRIGYDNDGAVVYQGGITIGGPSFAGGPIAPPLSGTSLIALNGQTYGAAAGWYCPGGSFVSVVYLWVFFPELREVTGWSLGVPSAMTAIHLEGSSNTTNGVDGTWQVATLGGTPCSTPSLDGWRANIGTVSFTGPMKAIRFYFQGTGYWAGQMGPLHLYGTKGAGQTPDDILYLDGQNAYATFTSVEDFGDVPLGTTTVRTFKVKNGSATKTANSINLQCNDADFAISSDGVTWVTTLNIASLAAGASSAVLYVRNTTPAPGGQLGPRFSRVVATVGSWV